MSIDIEIEKHNNKATERSVPWSDRALSAFFRKVDRLISGNLIVVHAIDGGKGAPSWLDDEGRRRWAMEAPTGYSTSMGVYLNYEKIWLLSDCQPEVFIPVMKALNYHEYAHIQYTVVRKDKDAAPYAEAHGLDPGQFCQMLNWLEDLRIETIFTRVYPRSIPYFQLLTALHIKLYGWTWVMTYGRKYLPLELRRLHMGKIQSASPLDIAANLNARRVTALIDEYITTTKKSRMLDITREVMDLLPEAPPNVTGDDSLTGRGQMTKQAQAEAARAVRTIEAQVSRERLDREADRIESQANQRHGAQSMENTENMEGDGLGSLDELDEVDLLNDVGSPWDDLDPAVPDGDGEGDGGPDDGDDGEGEGSEGEAESGSGQGEGDGYSPGTGEGSGSYTEPEHIEGKDSDSDLDETFERRVDEILHNTAENLKGETYSDIQQIEAKEDYRIHKDLEQVGRQVSVVLRKVRNDLKPGYVHKQRSGRINIRAAMASEKTGNTRIFDQYRDSKVKKTKMGVVIHIDGSSSMGSRDYRMGQPISLSPRRRRIDIALDAAEALAYGFEKADCKVKVYVFDDAGYLVKDWKDKEVARMYPGGCTDPSSTLQAALQDFKDLKKQGYETFINVIVTDGDFTDNGVSDDLIRHMNNQGIYTIEVGIGYGQTSNHGSLFYQVVKGASDLVPYLHRIVKHIAVDLRKKYRP